MAKLKTQTSTPFVLRSVCFIFFFWGKRMCLMTFALTCWALCASLTPPCRLFFSLNALKPLSACLGPFMFPFNRGYSPTNTSHVSEMNTSGATWSAELPCHFHEMCSSECLPLRNVEKIDLHQEWIGHCFYPAEGRRSFY